MNRSEIGLAGENAAAVYLQSRGWSIRHRRFRVRGGEVDLVAERGDLIVFAEVKTRSQGSLDDGRGAVTAAKRRRIARAARVYLARHALAERPCRFDVLTVEADGCGGLHVAHYEAAFDLS